MDLFTRKRIMSSIKSKNTKPEMIIRKGLFRRGYRYRLYDKKIPGTPDVIFPRFQALIFVHGCFWHGHGCKLYRMPKNNVLYWESKILRNQQRDSEILQRLLSLNWRVMLIWECAIVGKYSYSPDTLFSQIEKWLHSSNNYQILEGRHELEDEQ